MAVAAAARNSPGQSMLGFTASFTASWASWRARWGFLGWLLNLKLHPLSSQSRACGFRSAAAWAAGRVDGNTPVSEWVGRAFEKGDQETFRAGCPRGDIRLMIALSAARSAKRLSLRLFGVQA